MVDLLYLFLAVRKVESTWGARHRHQHAPMPFIRSLLAHIIAHHAVFSSRLAWLGDLIKQLLLLDHAILIVEAEAVQAIWSHALLTRARLS